MKKNIVIFELKSEFREIETKIQKNLKIIILKENAIQKFIKKAI